MDEKVSAALKRARSDGGVWSFSYGADASAGSACDGTCDHEPMRCMDGAWASGVRGFSAKTCERGTCAGSSQGGVIGGVVGGLAFLVLTTLGAVIIVRKHRREASVPLPRVPPTESPYQQLSVFTGFGDGTEMPKRVSYQPLPLTRVAYDNAPPPGHLNGIRRSRSSSSASRRLSRSSRHYVAPPPPPMPYDRTSVSLYASASGTPVVGQAQGH